MKQAARYAACFSYTRHNMDVRQLPVNEGQVDRTWRGWYALTDIVFPNFGVFEVIRLIIRDNTEDVASGW
jgi:hypothetical protein